MTTKTFALIFGAVFLLMGAAGFLDPFVEELGPLRHDLDPRAAHVLLFGLFPVNWLHNIVHLLFGVWGLVAARSLGASVAYARAVAIIYAVLTVCGFIPGLDTMFGLVPLYGNDIWLHALLALVGAYFGWVHRNPVTV